MVKRALSTLILFLFLMDIQAQQPVSVKNSPLISGTVLEFYSEALGENRKLNIQLPVGYNPDTSGPFPVIYLLDGSAHEDFPHIAGLVHFLSMYELMPPSILVGIENVDRYRDFTYPSSDSIDLKYVPTSGGADAFMASLKTEMMPLIEANYLTNGHNTLIGQSLGGLMGTTILMRDPGMFQDYILVSPSLWWDKQRLAKDALDYFKKHRDIRARVFVSLGKEHPEMHQVADMLVKAMRKAKNPYLEVFYEQFPNENHATILHHAAYRALEVLHIATQESEKK